jgi:hypothetical protein
MLNSITNGLGDSAQNNINTNDYDDVICLIASEIMAPLGRGPGTITAFAMTPEKDKDGKVCDFVSVTVTLDAKNDKGVGFVLPKTFNLSTARGKTAFTKIAGKVIGRDITGNDLNKFRKSWLLNKRVEAEVGYRKEGSRTVAYMKDFFPIAA